MPRPTDTRDKMITSAAALLREDGVAGTGFRDVGAHSGTPRGSIGHPFPGGQRQLVSEAGRWAGWRGGGRRAAGWARARDRGPRPRGGPRSPPAAPPALCAAPTRARGGGAGGRRGEPGAGGGGGPRGGAGSKGQCSRVDSLVLL